jgi:hypothetical protein
MYLSDHETPGAWDAASAAPPSASITMGCRAMRFKCKLFNRLRKMASLSFGQERCRDDIRDRNMHILCWLGFHSVDRKHAKFDGEVYRSRCRRCRARMIREASGWELIRPSS